MPAGNIILVGMMCSGKSTAGKALAELLHRPFADIDADISANAGKSIADIFANDGEQVFRQLESRALSRALQTGGQVIATGGGIVCNADNIRQMHADVKNAVCYLHAPPEVLATRALADGANRPLLDGCDDAASARDVLATLFAEREKFYERAAHCRVDAAADCAANNIAKRIVAAVLHNARFGE